LTHPDEITALLNQAAGGSRDAIGRLVPLVYDELRELARHNRYRWRDERSPSTGSLVHEAYIKLVGQTQVKWESRAQFFYLASRAMRSILIDNARHFARQKRGGGQRDVPLTDVAFVSREHCDELIDLNDALDHLQQADEQLAGIVECRFFGGLTIEESAAALGISPATVKRGWNLARAWLFDRLHGSPGSVPVPGA
jgi:RNA polymerase sigma factor (TIGR02999 family)